MPAPAPAAAAPKPAAAPVLQVPAAPAAPSLLEGVEEEEVGSDPVLTILSFVALAASVGVAFVAFFL